MPPGPTAPHDDHPHPRPPRRHVAGVRHGGLRPISVPAETGATWHADSRARERDRRDRLVRGRCPGVDRLVGRRHPRLGRQDRAASFLLADDPRFGPRSRAVCERVLATTSSRPLSPTEKAELFRVIDEPIQPIDVAGLGDETRRGWFPARAEDLIAAASKLDVTAAEMRTFLIRCGFTVPPAPAPIDPPTSSSPQRAGG